MPKFGLEVTVYVTLLVLPFRYFPVECTQEMLDEWRPLLCPFDVTVMKGLSYLDRFLPTNLPEEQMDQGFR